MARNNCDESQRGATAVEYGLLIALIAAGCVGVVIVFGDLVVDLFDSVDW